MQSANVTQLLQAAGGGDRQAAVELFPIVYSELRHLADCRMNKLPPGQTLSPTGLVHEVVEKLLGLDGQSFENRAHFFFACARKMRDILVERAREKASGKRGGDRKRVSIENLNVAIDAPPDDLLDLDEALKDLERENPLIFKLVSLRYYAGLTMEQAADLVGLELRTAERKWQFARARLHERLT